IVGTATAGSHVKVFSGRNGALLRSFLAFAGYTGGVNVAGGDVNNDGFADIIVGTALGADHVKAFSGANTSTLLASFFAYGVALPGGVFVASGDLDGDGFDEIITGAGSSATHVKAFTAAGVLRASFIAYPGVPGGVRVGSVDADGDGTSKIVTGLGWGAPPQVKVFDPPGFGTISSFLAFAPGFLGGVSVA